MARECEVERKVVAGYVGILEDLLLAFRLPVFRKRAKRATVTRDTLYLFDAGVFRSLRPKGPLDRPEETGRAGAGGAGGAASSGLGRVFRARCGRLLQSPAQYAHLDVSALCGLFVPRCQRLGDWLSPVRSASVGDEYVGAPVSDWRRSLHR